MQLHSYLKFLLAVLALPLSVNSVAGSCFPPALRTKTTQDVAVAVAAKVHL